jgi:hypothetical protein
MQGNQMNFKITISILLLSCVASQCGEKLKTNLRVAYPSRATVTTVERRPTGHTLGDYLGNSQEQKVLRLYDVNDELITSIPLNSRDITELKQQRFWEARIFLSPRFAKTNINCILKIEFE